MNLELLAIEYLRFQRSCPIALRERSPRWCIGQPDVIGVTNSRYLYEVEIKRSVSDFRADFQKRHRKFRELEDDYYMQFLPKLFWYCVLPEIADRVQSELPAYAGLLVPDPDYQHRCLKQVSEPTANTKSNRLSIKECLKLGRNMANHILSLEKQVDNWRSLYRSTHAATIKQGEE